MIFNKNTISFKIGQEDNLDIEQFYYETGTQMRMNKFTFDILNLFDGDLSANETFNLLTNEHIDIDYKTFKFN